MLDLQVGATIAIVLSIVTYALPSFEVQLSKADNGHLDSLFRKVLMRGDCSQSFTIDDLIFRRQKSI